MANAPADQKQVMLAAGISKAMYTTAGGLVVAIPTLVGNAFLTAMVAGIMDQVDQSATLKFSMKYVQVVLLKPLSNLSETVNSNL